MTIKLKKKIKYLRKFKANSFLYFCVHVEWLLRDSVEKLVVC